MLVVGILLVIVFISISIELVYFVFAAIFKHEAGLMITAILFGLYVLFGFSSFSSSVSSVSHLIITLVGLVKIGLIERYEILQIRNKGKKPSYHYYWYKERIARIDVHNLSYDFEFYENNEWVKNDKLSYALFEAIRISVEKWGKDIYKITNKERAIELINKVKGNPETQDLDSEIQDLDSEIQELDSKIQDSDSEMQDSNSN